MKVLTRLGVHKWMKMAHEACVMTLDIVLAA